MTHPFRWLGVLVACSFLAVAARSQTGITGKPAPQWGIKKWIQLPEGKTALEVGDLKGKVVHIFAFQAW